MEGINHIENNKESLERKSFKSNLEKADGSFENFSIKLDKDGKPPLIVFEDIDKTLLHLEPTYNEIRKSMWPDAVKKDGLENFSKVHLDGFRLGTMWCELYHMYAIYSLGKEEWKDADIYAKDFLASGKKGEHIDEPGNIYHEISNRLLEKFDDIASETVEKQAKENPEFFEKSKIKSVYKLNTLYKKSGVVVVGMTANPKKFANALCKYAGLAESFMDCATDTDIGVTKEYKMKWLIKKLEQKGIKIPYDKLLIIGDSPIGDVGNASRFQKLEVIEHPEVSASGIVINGNDKDLENAIEKLSKINDININAFDYSKVPEDINGNPQLYSKDRKEFYTEINSKK